MSKPSGGDSRWIIHSASRQLLLQADEVAGQQEVQDLPAAVAQRLEAERRQYGVDGALVHDGERLGQLLVGTAAAIGAWIERLREDARLTALRVLHQGRIDAGAWGRAGWFTSWAPPASLATLESPPAPGIDGLEAFGGLLARCDLL